MVKKSYRKRIDEYWQDPKEEQVYRKMNTITTLLNRCIHHTVSLPGGHVKCPECDSKKVLLFDSQQWRIRKFRDDGMNYLLSLCNMCKGKGYIDFVTNAMGCQDSQIGMGTVISVPFYLLQHPKLEAASMIFYTLYYTDYLYGINAHLSLNSNYNKKTVSEFIRYFSKYKKERDKRKLFIDQNFIDLRDQVIKLTKSSHIPSLKIICKVCNGNPFDIEHNHYNDDIRIKVCGNCYGQGYQSKRDTKGIANYIFEVDYPYTPKYDSKKDMLYTILQTAAMERDCFTLQIGKMKFKDQKKKKGR